MITGVIYKVFDKETHRDFVKKRFWVQELNVKYPNMWELEMWHDGVSELAGYKIGDVIACKFRPHGRLYDAQGSNEQKVKIILQCTEISMVYESPVIPSSH